MTNRRGCVVAAVLAALVACKGEVQRAQPGDGKAPERTGGGPAISCDEPAFQFGTVAEGDVVTHTFVVKNTGSEVLRIESARGSCGCTATVVSNQEVPPGGDAKIDVRLNTAGRRGHLEKTVVVASNDPKTPRLTLKVVGEVEVLAGFSPAYLNLGRILKGTKQSKTVNVEAKEPAGLRLLDVSSNDPRIQARILEGPAVEVTVTAGDQEGPLAAMVTAKTNLEKPKEIVLRVNGLVSGDLGVEPPRAFFRDFDPANPQSLDLRVTALTQKPFRLLGVEDASGAIRGTVKPDGTAWVASVTLAKKTDATEGTLRLRTDRKDQPVLEVPYRIGGRPGGFRAGAPLQKPAPRAVPGLRNVPAPAVR